MHLRVVAFIGLGSGLAAGCADAREPETHVCTAIGCDDGLGIEIPGRGTVPATALPVGDVYELQLGYDDTVIVCQNAWSGGQPTFRCADPSQNSAAFELGGSDQGPIRVLAQIEGAAPEALTVMLRIDGELVALASLTPRYNELFPNGAECDVLPCRRGLVSTEIELRSFPDSTSNE